jgi:single-stranded-DNA-specific exonuclease
MSIVGDIAKGSARSIKNINIGKLIVEAKINNLIIDGGGHPMAAGFSLEKEKIHALKDFLENKIQALLTKFPTDQEKKYSLKRSL